MDKITIKCPICKTENGVQNICCISCGSKLEKNIKETIIKKEKKTKPVKQKSSSPNLTEKKTKDHKDHNELYRRLFDIFCASCALALIGLIFCKPDLPKPTTQVDPLISFNNKLNQIQNNQISHSIFTNEEIAAFLKKEIFKVTKVTDGNENIYVLFPHQTIISFNDNFFSLFLSGKIFNLELFFKIQGFLELAKSNLSIKITKLYLGNLPIPSFILKEGLKRLPTKLEYYLEPPIAYIAIKNNTLVISSTHRAASSKRKKDSLSPQQEENLVYEWELNEEEHLEETTTELSQNIKEEISQQPEIEPEIEPEINNEKQDETIVSPINPALYFEPKKEPVKKEKPLEYDDKSYKLGLFFYNKKNYILALKHFEQLLKEYPNHPKALEVRDFIDDINIKINS